MTLKVTDNQYGWLSWRQLGFLLLHLLLSCFVLLLQRRCGQEWSCCEEITLEWSCCEEITLIDIALQNCIEQQSV